MSLLEDTVAKIQPPDEAAGAAVRARLEALLGADEDHLMRDWETTAFWNRNVTFAHVERYDKLVEGFKQSFPADTVRERVEKYVLSLGFTPEDIEKFRGIMLEEKESGK